MATRDRRTGRRLSVFVDTSVFFAAADRSDLSHGRAREILARGEPLTTTDHVLVECWLLLFRRLGAEAARRFWLAIRAGAARIEPVGIADLDVAWRIGEAFADQAFSIVDRTSFAVMQRIGVLRAASFDSHFLVYRFGPDGKRAFEVLR